MGITDSADALQRAIEQSLRGLEGIDTYIDDIFVHEETREIHDSRIKALLSGWMEMVSERQKEAGSLPTEDWFPGTDIDCGRPRSGNSPGSVQDC